MKNLLLPPLLITTKTMPINLLLIIKKPQKKAPIQKLTNLLNPILLTV